MTFDSIFFLVAAPAAIFAGVAKAGFGAGASFAAAAMMALVVPPGVALGVMLPLLLMIDVTGLRAYRGKWDWPGARILLLGGIPGTAIGAALWRVANDDIIRLLIGIIAIVFVAWQVGRARGWIRISDRPVPAAGGLVAGAVAGFTSFVSHAGGPPVAIYLLAKRLDKTTYQATTVLIFWVLNVVKVVPYAFLGIFTAQTLLADLLLAPFAIFGAWLGVKMHHRVPEAVFFSITYVLLVVTGLKLIADALL